MAGNITPPTGNSVGASVSPDLPQVPLVEGKNGRPKAILDLTALKLGSSRTDFSIKGAEKFNVIVPPGKIVTLRFPMTDPASGSRMEQIVTLRNPKANPPRLISFSFNDKGEALLRAPKEEGNQRKIESFAKNGEVEFQTLIEFDNKKTQNDFNIKDMAVTSVNGNGNSKEADTLQKRIQKYENHRNDPAYQEFIQNMAQQSERQIEQSSPANAGSSSETASSSKSSANPNVPTIIVSNPTT